MMTMPLDIPPSQCRRFPSGLDCGDRGRCLRAGDPEGIAAHSRWLSKAIPPEKRLPRQPIPEGLQPCESLRGPHRLESLRDTRDTLDAQSGGIAALNHRLWAATPAGWECWTRDILVRRMRDGQGCPSYGASWIAAAIAFFVMVSSVVAAEPTPPPMPEAEQADVVAESAATDPAPPKDAPLPQPEEPGADVPTPDAEAMVEELSAAEVLLDEALAAMDAAVLELDGDEPTPAAVLSQQLAVDRLKELLEAASQSQSSNSSSQKKNSSTNADPSDPQNEPPQESSPSDPSGGGGRRADDQNSAESSENVTGPTMTGSGVLAPGARANSVWGHLPARDREALFRSLSDSFLPEYEAQIRRYYEAIAEKK